MSLLPASILTSYRCEARTTDENGELVQCDGILAAKRQHWCPQHREEYTQRYSAYKRVSMQAEVLALIFDEVEYMAVEACYDVKKIGAAARLVEQYVVRLDEAIRGREEHNQMFFATRDPGHHAYVNKLKGRKESAVAFLSRLDARMVRMVGVMCGGRATRDYDELLDQDLEELCQWELEEQESRDMEIIRLQAEIASFAPYAEEAIVAPSRYCEALLSYDELDEDSERCLAPVLAPAEAHPFCDVHSWEHDALMARIDTAQATSAESWSALAAVARRYKSGDEPAKDAVGASLVQYVASLDVLLELEEKHRCRFGCSDKGYASCVEELKGMRAHMGRFLDYSKVLAWSEAQ